MSLIAASLKFDLEKEERTGEIRAISWQHHLDMGHVPYRRDCFVCQRTQQQQPPHRRVKHPMAGVLSLDTMGPLLKAYDRGGPVVRYALVGALTWAIPTQVVGLPDAAREDAPLPEDAPPIEEQEEEQPVEEGEVQERGAPTEEAGEQEEGSHPEEELPQVLQEGSEEEKEQYELKTFRLVVPMKNKKAAEVSSCAMEMILRLRGDGYHITHIHTDQGHEFAGHFRKWCRERGVRLTKTPGDDPRANGRAELAVKCMKSQIRRALLQGNTDSSMWPWAARYVNEVNRCNRVGTTPNWPPFREKILIRKRTWRRGSFEPTMQEAFYLSPAPEDHAHWVQVEGESPRLTRMVLIQTKEKVDERKWLAIERETLDEMAARRRIRGKSMARGLRMTEEEECEEEHERHRRKMRRHVKEMIEEEAKFMMEDNEQLVAEEMKILRGLKKMVEEKEVEAEEVLQTRVVSPKEVREEWSEWLKPIQEEIDSLITEKEAMRRLTKEEVEDLRKKAEAKGEKLQVIPSKMVFVVKPAQGQKNGKKKSRWVICGNFEQVREGETNYSGGADSTAFRVQIAAASRFQWSGTTLDVRTAFLNALMEWEPDEVPLLVRPPSILVEMGLIESHVLFEPLRAVYGFRRSPRLWGKQRDLELIDLRVPYKDESGREGRLRLSQLISEPNLWKLVDEGDGGEDMKVYGLLMSYVDDLFVTAPLPILEATVQRIRKIWKTSEPEPVSNVPTRFLGMQISKEFNVETGREEWFVSQQDYVKDLLQKEKKEVKEKKVPISKDLSSMPPEPEEERTAELVKQAQKDVGEILWVMTRTRPDVMFSTSRMGTMVLRNPSHVHDIFEHLLGYLKRTQDEGLWYALQESEPLIIEVHSDASFAPEATESHGSFIVSLNGSPLFWRSGRQGLISQSTAEAELVEITEGMGGGESVHVIVQEVFGDVGKRCWTDSQAAVALMCNEGGSWRTRHLKMRASAARSSIFNGDWTIQHKSGEELVADLGTKPLSHQRFEMLKEKMGMKKVPALQEISRPETEEVKKEEVERREEQKEEAEASKTWKVTTNALRLITFAAIIQRSKGEDEEEEVDESIDLTWPVMIFTIFVVLMRLGIQELWKGAVGLMSRSLPEGTEDPTDSRGDALDGGWRRPYSYAPDGCPR